MQVYLQCIILLFPVLFRISWAIIMRRILWNSFDIELNQSKYELCWEMKILGYEDAGPYTLVKASSSVKFLHSSKE